MADYSTSSPAAVNGMVFVGSYDHRLYAFDERDGSLLWTPTWADSLPRGLNSSPAVANGHIYIGCRDGRVYAFGI
jgi:outer membrane protein assembly factor BamB